MMATMTVGLGVVAGFAAIGLLYAGVPWLWGRLARWRLQRLATRLNSLVLTFDDGPGTCLSPEILDLLKRHDVKATFFLLGRNIPGREAVVQRAQSEGHEIASHGYGHCHYWKRLPLACLSDIRQGTALVRSLAPESSRTMAFRPPYGKLNAVCLVYLWLYPVRIVYWTLDSGDTWRDRPLDLEPLTSYVRRHRGAVVLLHDFDRQDSETSDYVKQVTERLLEVAAEEKLQVSTVSELLKGR